MPKKTILLMDIDLRDFYGVEHANWKTITQAESLSNLSIFALNEKIVVEGEEPDLRNFEIKIKQIKEFIRQNGHIYPDDIEDILAGHTQQLRSPEKNITILHSVSGHKIKVITESQRELVGKVNKFDLTFALGAAGTGKTYMAIALAVRALKNREVKKLIISRPAVEAGEKLGFLPGDMKEKLDPYLQAIYDALADMVPAKKLEEFMENRIIQIAPLAYMRGRTLDNAFVVLDEAQNATPQQMKMFLTRMGKNAKFVVTGDLSQTDLPNSVTSGLQQATTILKNVPHIGFVRFTNQDIVRHRLVKEIVSAYESLGQ